jgi:hypothetical protein
MYKHKELLLTVAYNAAGFNCSNLFTGAII